MELNRVSPCILKGNLMDILPFKWESALSRKHKWWCVRLEELSKRIFLINLSINHWFSNLICGTRQRQISDSCNRVDTISVTKTR